MNILAFDTAFSTCALGLLFNGKIITDDRYAPMQQSRLILPMISEVLHKAGCSPTLLDVIAYGCGPGSFTGVRIAQSVAQGIAYALEKEILPVSSLAILAQTARMEYGWEKVLVCVDARMGQVYWAEYELGAGGVMWLVGEEKTCKPDAIPEMDRQGWYAIGSGWEAYPAMVSQVKNIDVLSSAAVEPCSSAILALAENRIMANSL